MTLLLLSFLAGILTILAPCVLPLLPIILGGGAQSKNKWYPYIVIGSLALSIFIFTLVLKATTLLIDIPPQTWTTVSGVILVFFGLISVFPKIWDKISSKLKLSRNSDLLLDKASENQSVWQPVLLGAALGPVFSSCSFTYALLLAVVLPANFWWGIVNMISYILGLSAIMLSIAVLGSKLVKKAKFAADPNGWFKRGLGIIFLIVGIMIISGLDKVLQVFVADRSGFDITNIEKNILQKTKVVEDNSVSIESKGTPAPELVGLQSWINSQPKTLASLKGKVVLIDFWTYSCINCIRTQPYLNAWYDKYKDSNFEIIGVHAPEFAFEKKVENVQNAVTDAKIKYPVALDNDFKTWGAFKNQFWPAKYLIDKDGNIRYTHFGEGEYAETEANIQKLIAETGTTVDQTKVAIEAQSGTFTLTPETYLGWSRGDRFVDARETAYNVSKVYDLKTEIPIDKWSLGGTWQINNENIISQKSGNKLRLKYRAKNVFLVMGSDAVTEVKITTDSNSKLGTDVNNSTIKVKDYRLYKVVENQDYNSEGYIELEIPAGVEANAFTFG